MRRMRNSSKIYNYFFHPCPLQHFLFPLYILQLVPNCFLVRITKSFIVYNVDKPFQLSLTSPYSEISLVIHFCGNILPYLSDVISICGFNSLFDHDMSGLWTLMCPLFFSIWKAIWEYYRHSLACWKAMSFLSCNGFPTKNNKRCQLK